MSNTYIHPRNDYQIIIDEWIHQQNVGETTMSILKQGLWCCYNPPETHGGILIVGINPSYDKNCITEPKDCTFQETINSNGSNYWQTKHDMVRGLSVPVAYMDLFPLRMTKQDSLMKDNVIPIELKAALLQVTQKCIEAIHPRLIINPNMKSNVYWGVNDKYSWMGYDMELVRNPICKGQLYLIRGLKNRDDVLLPQMNTCLEGTYFLQYKYHGNGVLSREQFLTSEDINILWNHINQ